MIDGLIVQLDARFIRASLAEEAKVADAFLDHNKCPGARGLSEENKAKLQKILYFAAAQPNPPPPPPSSPPAGK